MAEIALNVDPMGGLWPVIPAPVPPTDDDLEIDVAFAAILHIVQGPAVQEPSVQGPTVQGSTVQGPRFDLVQGSEVESSTVQGPTVQGPTVQGPTVQGPQPELAAPAPAAPVVHAQVSRPAAILRRTAESARISELPGFSPAGTVELKPDGSEDAGSEELDVRAGNAAHPVVPADVASSPRADAASARISELPGFSPADTVEPKPDVSEDAGSEDPGVHARNTAHTVVPADIASSPRADAASVRISELPGFSPADTVEPKPDVSEDLGVRARNTAHTVVPTDAAPKAEIAALKPDGPEDLGARVRTIAPTVVPADITTSPTEIAPVRISELPGFSPADTVGLKPHGSEDVASKPQRQSERDEPAESPAIEMPAPQVTGPRTPSATPVEVPVTATAAQPVVIAPAPVVTPSQTTVVHDTPAPAALPQALVPTTDDGAPVMTRLVEMMRWQAREGGGQAELRLRPEFLGAVTVSIVVEKGAVKATVSAETSAALEYLRSEASGLQEALEERGLTLDEFEVREESSLAERRQDPEEKKQRQESAPAPRRRPVSDPEAVFNVLV